MNTAVLNSLHESILFFKTSSNCATRNQYHDSNNQYQDKRILTEINMYYR